LTKFYYYHLGCSGLNDVHLLVFDLTQSTPDYVFVSLQVSLTNPSIVNILPVGDLTFNMFYKDSFIGMMVANNVNLVVGQNILS